MSAEQEVDRATIATAAQLIRPYIRRTPIIEVDGADLGVDVPVVIKLEQLQRSGSFKARGAYANLLSRPLPAAGVAAASGGNHGAAVAYAARTLGVRARIFVPGVTSSAKQARIRNYGADLVVVGETYDEALAASRAWADDHGALEIHAFDHPTTIAGAGTIGLELSEQAPRLGSVLVAIGGGGLASGVSTWFAGSVAVVGVEPEGAPTMTRALEAGEPVQVQPGSVAEDSLAPVRVGVRTFELVRKNIASVVLVDDADIRQAQLALWDALRVVVEPGGATALAALLSGRYQAPLGVVWPLSAAEPTPSSPSSPAC